MLALPEELKLDELNKLHSCKCVFGPSFGSSEFLWACFPLAEDSYLAGRPLEEDRLPIPVFLPLGVCCAEGWVWTKIGKTKANCYQ